MSHPKGGLECLRCGNIITVEVLAEYEWDINKVRCPKCDRKYLGAGIE